MPKFKKGDAVVDKDVFKVGDTVIFTTPDAGNYPFDDSFALNYCEIGKEYKITSSSSICIFITGHKSPGLWVNPNQFTLKSEYDMQNKKQNLKPFNLERALAGDPVVTKNGRKITELRFFSTKNEHPVAGFIDGSNQLQQWTVQGQRYGKYSESDFDLFMAPIEKSGWIKIFTQQVGAIKATTSCIYDNEADALNFSSPGAPTGLVVQIKWTE